MIYLKRFNLLTKLTTLLKAFNDIMLDLHSGSGTFLILLDLSAAFDTIDCDVLCVYSVIWVWYCIRPFTFVSSKPFSIRLS